MIEDNYNFKTDIVINLKEYQDMYNTFSINYWYSLLWPSIITSIILIILCLINRKDLFFFVILDVFSIFIIMIYYKLNSNKIAEYFYNQIGKNKTIPNKYTLFFYDQFVIKQSDFVVEKIDYSSFRKIVESDDYFYIQLVKRVLIIKKQNINLEFNNFIRRLRADIYIDKTSKDINNSKIKGKMLILFVACLITFYLACFLHSYLNKIFDVPFVLSSTTMWVFWCFLPIPILSIVLGFKYKRVGYKCTKNIIAGFIIGFLLLGFGSFSMFKTFEVGYNKISDYKGIIDAKLPNNGELEIQNWGTYYDEDKTEYVIINAYYDKEDVTNLVNSIENSNNWILSKEIKLELRVFVPSQLRSDDDAYYSIYNKTTNQYNTLPINSGNYEIYTMKYDKSDKQLTIHKFKYLYR